MNLAPIFHMRIEMILTYIPYAFVVAMSVGVGYIAGNVAGRVAERRRRSRPAFTLDLNGRA